MAALDHSVAFVCSHIFAGTHPILLVSREDGDWQFLCGLDHDADEIPKVVGLGHIVEGDPTVSQIADLLAGQEAERSAQDQPWVRRG